MTMFERIEFISKKRGMSLREVNEKAKLGTNAIYRWKKQTPSVDKIKAVANVLGVSVDYLLGKSESQTTSDNKDLDVEEAIDSMRSYQGKEISESQREVLRGIIKGYLDNQGK
ncbi:helix-turn-helix transcriptional regulator [Pediococcus ethanolidurans]|uniref:helix-turn-helix domain-containing protein n=1 Tax=Pediococcus ethanolidurans TaxID=319653 RepID=UPI001C1EC110|nr:helix-turn-helix transcriptional regulator [Pediococcus ethanolidurans]MBU7562638.1 helix-turn-helix transcriptional regulator [Pediococcus ethanolidurans]MCT4397675.1 XRE family transcriptional regulator [Pediococcus ethanolidurans]